MSILRYPASASLLGANGSRCSFVCLDILGNSDKAAGNSGGVWIDDERGLGVMFGRRESSLDSIAKDKVAPEADFTRITTALRTELGADQN